MTVTLYPDPFVIRPEEKRLVTPSSSTIHIVKAAKEVLKGIYHQGYLYKRAGVIVLGITPDSPLQQDLFDLDAEHIQKFRQLDKVVDRINKRSSTISNPQTPPQGGAILSV